MPSKYRQSSSAGFMFIEIMVAIAIFSLGVVSIMQIFRLSLDRLQHLTNRIYANNVIENKISLAERVLRSQRKLPYDIENEERVIIGSKAVVFTDQLSVTKINDSLDLFKLDVALNWQEGTLPKRISRSTYIIDLRNDE